MSLGRTNKVLERLEMEMKVKNRIEEEDGEKWKE